jgi:hypothetical protein
MFGAENIYLIGGAGLMALICNFLYAVGGTDMDGPGPEEGKKWIRRFLGGGLLALTSSVVALLMNAWHWQYLLMFPALMVGFSMGYGAPTLSGKIFKRTLCATGVLLACVAGLYATGFTVSGWMVTGLAFITGLTSVVLGVKNPFNNAPLEQFLICQILTLYVPYWAFIK